MLKSLLCSGVIVSVVVVVVVVIIVVVTIAVVVVTIAVVVGTVVVGTVVVTIVVVTMVVVYGVIEVVVSDFFGTSITNFNSRPRVVPRSITMASRIIVITTERRCHHLRVLLLRRGFSLYTSLLFMLCLTRNFKLE